METNLKRTEPNRTEWMPLRKPHTKPTDKTYTFNIIEAHQQYHYEMMIFDPKEVKL